jgi:proteic killer suppression protein
MIRSFKHRGLERFFATGSKAGIQPAHARKLVKILTLLNRILRVEQMGVAGWDLHPLKGELSGYWSVKVNGNWRVTFRFENGEAEVVDYQDYH